MTLREAVGQVLVVGFEGAELTKMESAWLRLLQPGGVILFRRNVESAMQTHALLQSAEKAAVPPMLRYIDVEGGTVDRLRDVIAPMPSPFAVAATDKPALFEKHGSLIGEEVRMLGLNVTFAPVLDLRTLASEEVMTTRVVSGDPNQVARYARSFLKGLARQRVLGCGKHFPGLGSGQVDSHHATPSITKSFDLLWQEDLFPFRELAKQLSLVMISHAAYSVSGPEPASISSYWMRKVLRKQIGYKGLIVSDDMEMGGILTYMGMGEAAVRSIAAGTEIVEICRDPALIFAAYEAVLREAEESPSFARLVRRAAAKVRTVGGARSMRLATPPTAAAVRRMRTAVERFTQEVARGGPA
ncbi:MAG: beta-N-acetylhexosaminidase [Acidobacteriaceae bacterium]